MARAGLDATSVVAAAARVADRDGLEQLTLARLAVELGVRAPSLYAHVGGLGDLRDRVGAIGVVQLTESLSEAAAGRSGREALHAVAVAYRAYARQRPGVYAAMQRAPQAGDEREVAAARLVGVLTAVLRGYGLEGDDAIHAVRLLRSALHGFVSLEATGGFALPLGLDDTYERLIEMVDRGLRADGTGVRANVAGGRAGGAGAGADGASS
jgi:AcrR family transcriptional regulator